MKNLSVNKLVINNLPLLLIILLSVYLLSLNSLKPFVGHHDFTSAFNGIAARNYLEHGWINLKFGQVASLFGDVSEVRSFYTHYPPLLPILISISFLVFGVHEWAERLVPISFSLIGVISIYLITKKIWNIKTAIFSTLFFIGNPMFIYFGSMPVAEPVIVGLVLLSFYLYLGWIIDKSDKYLYYLLFTLFFAGLISWSVHLFGLLLVLHTLLISKFNIKVLLTCVVLGGSLMMQFLHAFILTGDVIGGGILDSIKTRTVSGSLSFGGSDFNLISFIKQEISWFQSYFTRVMLVFSAIGLFRNISKRFNLQNATLIIFLLYGLVYILIFSRYVFVHDFLNIYILPFLAISAGVGLNFLSEKLNKWFRLRVISILIIVCIVGFFFYERMAFTKALLNTSMNTPGVEMAELLNKYQTDDYQAVIFSDRFSDFYGVFTSFYSNYAYSIADDLSFKDYDKYRYIIFIDEDIKNKELYNSLISKYNIKRVDDITIIFLEQERDEKSN